MQSHTHAHSHIRTHAYTHAHTHSLQGAYEDAEGQIELLTVMHSAEDLGYEFSYLQAVLAKEGNKDLKKHLQHLDQCREQLQQQAPSSAVFSLSKYENFCHLVTASPDFQMALAVEYLEHLESPVSVIRRQG